MRFYRAIKIAVLVTFIIVSAASYFTGCIQESPVAALRTDEEAPNGYLAKKVKSSGITGGSAIAISNYPQSGSCTMYYDFYHQAYDGGNFTINNGSSFTVGWAALTPPAGTTQGANITVHMTVEYDSTYDALLFSFGPSGCQFNPAAEIWLKWKDLGGGGVPNLYYIDHNGSLILQTPDGIDYKGKRLLVRISHFSRYAVAFSQ